MTPSPASNKSTLFLPWLTLAAIVSTFVVNVLSNIYPLNGMNIGDISNTEFADVLITPANYAFAIWGVIYLGLFGFGIYQLLPAQRSREPLNTIRAWVIVACVAQIAWVYLFLMRFFWGSVVAMLAILISLIGVYLQRPQLERSRGDRWLIKVPFSIYLGWISVATVVNVATALYSVNWTGGGISPQIWTVAMLVVSGAIALILLWQRYDIAFAGVLIWAAVAIALRHTTFPLIAWSAWAVAIGLGIVVAISTFLPLGSSSQHRA
jgi:hypothetical protein